MRKDWPVVILDDSFEDRFFLKRYLRKLHGELEFIEFTYSEDALAWAKKRKTADQLFLFVDLNLPRSTGFEFLRLLQKQSPELIERAVIFAMSNSIDPEDREKAEGIPQVQKFLVKPVKDDVLSAFW